MIFENKKALLVEGKFLGGEEMAQVRTRKRGKTWSFIFEAGKIDGRRKVVEKYNDYLHGNIGITSESITLKNFMTAWLENVVAANVKVSTLQRYQRDSFHQIFPVLGSRKVQELTPAMLDAWLREFQKAGYAHKTISLTLSLLRAALDYAVYPAQLISSIPPPISKFQRMHRATSSSGR